MRLLKDLSELISAGVISEEIAEDIRSYYHTKNGQPTNRLLIVFGILGAILVGLGVILIIAHNWDQLARSTKTFFAFLPLVIGQGICGYALFRKSDRTAWMEGAASFLFFAVGASISLVSQIYNIPGNLSSYLLTWMLLCFPLMYVLRSSTASLLYLIGITFFACEAGYWSSSFRSAGPSALLYWPLLLLALPHYYQLYRTKPRSNFMTFHHWIFPLSVVICLGILAETTEELIFIAYFSLFGLFYLIGRLETFQNQKARNQGYTLVGSLGSVILLLTLSFDGFWNELVSKPLPLNLLIFEPEWYAATVLTLVAAGMLYQQFKKHGFAQLPPMAFVFVLFVLTFILGLYSTLSVVLINVIVLGLGIFTIRNGAQQNSLGVLNYGLLIITALIVCRFFDQDLSFVIRGLLFVSVGVGFFVANYLMLKKRKTHE